jgi:hypothetical protein
LKTTLTGERKPFNIFNRTNFDGIRPEQAVEGLRTGHQHPRSSDHATGAEIVLLADGIVRADSWATDAHKWLNVPQDSGIAIVRKPEPIMHSSP